MSTEREWILAGTYTEPILFGTGEILQGKGKGIHLLRFDDDSGRFAEAGVCGGVKNPSYLCLSPDKRYLYAVNELKEHEGMAGGTVSAFAVEALGGVPSLRFLNMRPTGGADPCHVSIDSNSRLVFVANFMSGSAAVFPVEADGSLGAASDFIQHAGSSRDPKRQAGPHAHAAVLTPNDRQVLIPDLGIDKLMLYAPDYRSGKLSPCDPPYLEAQPGDGPRFCEFHPGGRFCYLINELASSISLLHYDQAGGTFIRRQTVPSIPKDFTGANICADLHLTPDGRYLYASNRGHDSIAAYRVEPGTGELALITRFSCGGRTPRSFSLSASGRYLLVANQDSDNLLSFLIDYETGRAEKTDEVFVPTPVCVKSVRL